MRAAWCKGWAGAALLVDYAQSGCPALTGKISTLTLRSRAPITTRFTA